MRAYFDRDFSQFGSVGGLRRSGYLSTHFYIIYTSGSSGVVNVLSYKSTNLEASSKQIMKIDTTTNIPRPTTGIWTGGQLD